MKYGEPERAEAKFVDLKEQEILERIEDLHKQIAKRDMLLVVFSMFIVIQLALRFFN